MPSAIRVGLVVLSTLFSATATVPYLVATAKRQTRPRIVTWLTWALLTAVGGAASASVGDYPSAAFSFIGTVVTSAVVIAGLRYGDRTFGRLDVVCFVLVVGGFGLWLLLDLPGIAVGAACVIDFIGLVPTLAHAWRSPHEETAVTYAFFAAGGAAATAAAWGTWTVTAVAYPIYVLASMAVCWAVVVIRASQLATAEGSEMPGASAEAPDADAEPVDAQPEAVADAQPVALTDVIPVALADAVAASDEATRNFPADRGD
jgi:hypothetical protein